MTSNTVEQDVEMIQPPANHINNSSNTVEQDVEMIQPPANHINNSSSESWLTLDDIVLSTSFTSSEDQEINFRGDYYDTGSPGTIDELQCFWQQLFSQNLDHGNNSLNMF
ncbi:hypothetical protein L1987_21440 [Smallanthus sonchifolius]|uniref:Uncharacterized protein n=1 Tax=Smallanthus sonchifolius TaxID=185202 RepID=A0ACB9IW91_9ASTR|nr:hypothetical protein L1987_21440 [Smallanthus sonchifolius]